jgi:hypothetical protein
MLSPVLLGYELFIWVYSFASGWLPYKWRSYRDLLANRKHIRDKRKQVQALRRIEDREIARHLTSVLIFDELTKSPIRFANQALTIYWRLVNRLF